jgi:N-succinyl-L-ornithine transcarbamylase
MRSFTTVHDVDDIAALVALGRQLKDDPLRLADMGRGKTIVMLFFNPSLRTRLSTQKAAQHLGMHVISMNAAQGWKLEFRDHVVMDGDSAEHIREAAGVISQYGDIIAIRSFPALKDQEEDYRDEVIRSFVHYADKPVISLESATRHPLQSLADLITIDEKGIERPRIVLSWAPHPRALPQSVPNSFAEWVLKSGHELVITCPEGFELDSEFSSGAQYTPDQNEAFAGADFIYAKNWSSYRQYGQTKPDAQDWMITTEKMKLTRNGWFMHCLPVRRNVVVEDSVLDGEQSLVLEQANNRTFAAQAVLKKILEDNF